MPIRLIATDMDGTLLNSKKEKPADFIPWVKAHPQIRMVIASGRQYYTLKRDFTEIADQLTYIAENGGFVFEKDEMIYSNAMSRELVRLCLEVADSIPGVTPIVCGGKSAYMRHTTQAIEDQGHMYYNHLIFMEDLYACIDMDVIPKVALYIEGHKAVETAKLLKDLPPQIKPVVSGSEWIDLSNASVNKGSAIKAIQEKYGISPDECMAFGDYMNDYDLIRNVTESYVMENGLPEMKAIAKYIAPSNEEEGVMQILRQRFPDTV